MSNSKVTNPLQETNTARIYYLQNALNQAVKDNKKAKAEYRNLYSHLSGMIKISGNQQADLTQKQIAAGKTDMNEDLLRGSLMDALNSQALFYNA